MLQIQTFEMANCLKISANRYYRINTAESNAQWQLHVLHFVHSYGGVYRSRVVKVDMPTFSIIIVAQAPKSVRRLI